MAAHVRMRILLAAAVAVICGGVFGVTELQRRADSDSFTHYVAVQKLRGAAMRMALTTGDAVGQGEAAAPQMHEAAKELDVRVAAVGRIDWPRDELALVRAQVGAAADLGAIGERALHVTPPGPGQPGPPGRDVMEARGKALDAFRVANDELTARLDSERRATETASARRPEILVATLCLVFGLLHLVLVERPAREERRRRRERLASAEAQAVTDALTGLPNRRALDEALRRAVAHAGRSVEPLALVLFDLDHFKAINDTFGHAAGDAVLAAVGRTAAEHLRASDMVARAGGEEFALILPDTGREGALEAAEKLRAAIAAIAVPGVGRGISASFGVALIPDDAGEAAGLFRAADRALYAAKRAGRDRVAVA